MERPSWQAYFTTLVQHVSTRSPCNRLKVGCLIVRDNRIISQGYNGFLPGLPHTSVVVDNHEIATIHAEQNALTDCAKRGVSCDKSVAYITHYPCLNCAKLLYSAGSGSCFVF
jgi:dCMP deaminase